LWIKEEDRKNWTIRQVDNDTKRTKKNNKGSN
jgi:hypothetical protein